MGDLFESIIKGYVLMSNQVLKSMMMKGMFGLGLKNTFSAILGILNPPKYMCHSLVLYLEHPFYLLFC